MHELGRNSPTLKAHCCSFVENRSQLWVWPSVITIGRARIGGTAAIRAKYKPCPKRPSYLMQILQGSNRDLNFSTVFVSERLKATVSGPWLWFVLREISDEKNPTHFEQGSPTLHPPWVEPKDLPQRNSDHWKQSISTHLSWLSVLLTLTWNLSQFSMVMMKCLRLGDFEKEGDIFDTQC